MKPKKVLLLTGEDWAGPFKDVLDAYETEEHAKVVIKPHPQGKNGTEWVADVVKKFN